MAFYKIGDEPLQQKPKKPETYLQGLLRNVSSGLAKGVGSVASLPTQAVKFGESLVGHAEHTRNKALEHGLQSGNLYGESPEKVQQFLEESKKNPTQKPVLTPKIEQVENKVKQSVESVVGKDYLKPRNKTEEYAQDFISNIPLHFALGGTAKNLWPTLKGIAAGDVAAKGVEYAGGGHGAQTAARFLTPAFMHGRNVKNVQEYFNPKKDVLYDEAIKNAGNKSIAAPQFKKHVEQFLEKEYAGSYKGGTRHKKNLEGILNQFSHDEIPLKDLPGVKEKLNRLIYQETGSPNYFKKLLSDVNETINKSGVPGFIDPLRKADKLSQILNKTYQTDSYVQRLIKSPDLKGIVASAIFGPPSRTQYELFSKLPKEGFKYYVQAIEAATRKNPTLFVREVKKINQLLDKSKEKPKSKGFYKIA